MRHELNKLHAFKEKFDVQTIPEALQKNVIGGSGALPPISWDEDEQSPGPFNNSTLNNLFNFAMNALSQIGNEQDDDNSYSWSSNFGD